MIIISKFAVKVLCLVCVSVCIVKLPCSCIRNFKNYWKLFDCSCLILAGNKNATRGWANICYSSIYFSDVIAF